VSIFLFLAWIQTLKRGKIKSFFPYFQVCGSPGRLRNDFRTRLRQADNRDHNLRFRQFLWYFEHVDIGAVDPAARPVDDAAHHHRPLLQNAQLSRPARGVDHGIPTAFRLARDQVEGGLCLITVAGAKRPEHAVEDGEVDAGQDAAFVQKSQATVVFSSLSG
jgi:hypothetical protein